MKAYRTLHGLNQTEFGRMIGVTKAEVSRYEGGQRQIPASRAVRIERVTGIPRIKMRPDIFGDPPAQH